MGLVAELMRELGLAAVQPRAYKRTTIRGEDPHDCPDLIGRDFTAGPAGGTPGTRLVGDITYLRTGEGWLYLATVIDLATRMVVGWQLADHMRTTLVVDALEMARTGGHVARDAIFHSDRGTQYTSREFHQYCQGIQRSEQRRPDRGVLGQRRRRELLLRAEERDVPPPAVPDQSPRPLRRRRLHRSVLQPTAGCTPPSATAPQPRPSPIPNRSNSCMINNRESVQDS